MPTTPALREMVATLVGTPSVSSALPQFDQSNQAVIDTLSTWLEPLGFDIAIAPVPGKARKANLIATRGSGRGGLVLSGHTDTVPFDENLWQSDPFELTERNDRWYGLGTCDMKSFFALIIEALAPYGASDFKRPLTILATADEESSMSGARVLTAAELSHARFAMIGEPTCLHPVRRHKGIMMLTLNVSGSSGHSSNPELGTSALDAMPALLEELFAYRQRLREQYRDPSFEVDYPTLNLGCIHGGDNPNRICDHVDLAFDVRLLPGMDNRAVMAELEKRLHKRQTAGLTVKLNLLFPWVQPFESSGDEFASVLEKLSGFEPGSVAFATEAPFLTELGVETMVLGPGSIDQAHQPDEYVELSQLEPSIAIIRRLIEKYCLSE